MFILHNYRHAVVDIPPVESISKVTHHRRLQPFSDKDPSISNI